MDGIIQVDWDLQAALHSPEFGRDGRLLQQFSDIWMIEEKAGIAVETQIRNWLQTPGAFAAHVAEHREAMAAEEANRPYQLANGNVAVIPISGTITKYGSSLSNGGSTLRARRALQAALADTDVRGILLHIESPGGTVTGVHELARDVRNASAQKNLWTYFEDIGASAAYWIGSQASQLYTDEMGMVGSIGSYMVVSDYSQMAANDGIKVHVIRNGSFKGAGMPGTEITADQLANWQGHIDDITKVFHTAVQSARNLDREQLAAVTDGRVHRGKAAQKLGLVDGVKSLDKVLADLSRLKPMGAAPKASASVPDTVVETSMSTSTAAGTPAPATFQELVAACPGINQSSAEDAMFLTDCLSKSLTATAATAAWCQTLNARAATARQEAEASRQQVNQSQRIPSAGPRLSDGHPNQTGGTSVSSGDPIGEWNAAVLQVTQAQRCSKADAVKQLVRDQPHLHESFVNAWRAKYPAVNHGNKKFN